MAARNPWDETRAESLGRDARERKICTQDLARSFFLACYLQSRSASQAKKGLFVVYEASTVRRGKMNRSIYVTMFMQQSMQARFVWRIFRFFRESKVAEWQQRYLTVMKTETRNLVARQNIGLPYFKHDGAKGPPTKMLPVYLASVKDLIIIVFKLSSISWGRRSFQIQYSAHF